MWEHQLRLQEVFTPFDLPTVTYVDRAEHKLEKKLRDLYDTPNLIVSVSGPSKSGKTVLIKKVVPEESLITVRGASIDTADGLWSRVLDWMDVPNEVQATSTSTNEIIGGAEGGGKVKVPVFAEGEAKAKFEAKRGWGKGEGATYQRTGLEQVIKEIGKSEFVVFIDDFHYIKPDIRDDIGKQIKAAAESGVKVMTASVPHRADDVVRTNSELRGRVAAVDIEPWSKSDLAQIARKGFTALNVDLAPNIEATIAKEAFGSPQLMQSICMNLALVTDTRETRPALARIDVQPEQVREAFLRTSSFTDFSRMVRDLHIGAKTRGTERKEHDLTDGTKGDVYRAILLAMTMEPAKLSFNYDDITARVRDVCKGDAPSGSSVNAALTQMHGIAESLQGTTSPIAWDDPTLDIVDPYFLFFLRCSGRLASLV